MSRQKIISFVMPSLDSSNALYIDYDHYFDGKLKVMAKDNHIVLIDMRGGALSIHRTNLKFFTQMMNEITEIWEDVRTD